MVDAAEIIEAFGGPTAFGRAIGVKPSAASEMKRRKSIPVRHWPNVLNAARERGVVVGERQLDSDLLMEANAERAA